MVVPIERELLKSGAFGGGYERSSCRVHHEDTLMWSIATSLVEQELKSRQHMPDENWLPSRLFLHFTKLAHGPESLNLMWLVLLNYDSQQARHYDEDA